VFEGRGVLDTPPASAGYDEAIEISYAARRNSSKNKKQSAKPQRPLERSIPEFPTKVGGHHMSGSTDPARDSSLKDR